MSMVREVSWRPDQSGATGRQENFQDWRPGEPGARKRYGGSWNIANAGAALPLDAADLLEAAHEYADFPMPDEFPDHPASADLPVSPQLRRSLQSATNIEFNARVQRVEPARMGDWPKSSSGWPTTSIGWIVRSNPVNASVSRRSDRKWAQLGSALPNYPGQFDGETIHSSQYKRELFAGRRVSCGGGNWGSTSPAKRLNTQRRRSQLAAGLPYSAGFTMASRSTMWRVDVAVAAALWFRRLGRRGLRGSLGRLGCRDMPRPDHALFATHR